MNETIINTALWTACSILAFLAMARMLRGTRPDPVPVKIRVHRDTGR
jgi:hypothetical protein